MEPGAHSGASRERNDKTRRAKGKMRICCSGPILLLLTANAAAQTRPAPDPSQPADPPPVRIWRGPPGPLPDGRLAMPMAGNLHFGVGRYAVLEPARPRTHTEPIARSAEIARRHRGIAAVGISLRF